MKLRSKAVTIGLLLTSILVFSQEKTKVENNVKTNFLGYFFKFYSVSYERALTSNLSGQITFGKMGNVLDGNFFDSASSTEEEFSAIYVIPELRYYPKNLYTKGFYLSAFSRINFIHMEGAYNQNGNTRKMISENATQFNAGFKVGWNWHFNQVLLDLGFGPEFVFDTDFYLYDESNYEVLSVSYSDVMPNISLSVGYSF